MSAHVLAAFIAACVLLALTPGPNMAMIIANTLTGGVRTGLATVAGTTTGLALLVTAAVAGMGSLMTLMWAWFDVVRWIGALYLVYLGARQLWLLRRSAGPAPPAPATRASMRGAYAQGLGVSLSNPKVILFLGAFLPQFVDGGGAVLPQLVVLAAIFVAVLALVDLATTLAVGRARASLGHAHLRAVDGAAGILLVAGGLALAVARRP